MITSWNEYLNLPESCLAGDRAIPKTQLVRAAGLTKTEEKKLKGIASLRHFATVQKSTARILPVQNERYEINALIVLCCELRSGTAPAEAAELVHKSFPNPVLLLANREDGRIGVSASLKRKSEAERGAVVLEKLANSNLFDFSGTWAQAFLRSISFESLNQTDLLSLAQMYASRIELARVAPSLGFFPSCEEADIGSLFELARCLASSNSQIKELEELRKAKDTSLAESSQLRVRLREEKKRRAGIAAEIKELCHEQ